MRQKASLGKVSQRAVEKSSKSRPTSKVALATGLSQEQLKILEAKLRDLKNQITEVIGKKMGMVLTQQTHESLIKGDDAEVAEKQRMSNAALQEIDIMKYRLQLVNRALNKMARGDFGYCEETEEFIGFDRLMIVPWARFCIEVQERREKKLREFKSNRLAEI